MTTYPIEWWLERLSGVKSSGSGWSAICPAHQDVKSSLSLALNEDGDVLVHCFAGCQYHQIVALLEDTVPMEVVLPLQVPTIPQSTLDPKIWWSEYTGVPVEFWSSLGVIFTDLSVVFTWRETRVRKIRTSGQKMYSWAPSEGACPPLWPSVPKIVSEVIVLCEGESDTGVARFCGVDAFGITKGSATPRLDAALSEMKNRGMRRVITMFDLDRAGQEGASKIQSICEHLDLEYGRARLDEIINPLLGEKDLRDAWLRLRNVERIRRSSQMGESSDSRRYLLVEEFLGQNIPRAQWLVRNLLLRQTIQMIVGAPKQGKTWLALDLAVSVASGVPFLGRFDVSEKAPVILITKEDPNYLLQDRLKKILHAKGLGGLISNSMGSLQIEMPEDAIPLFLDLNRDFVFTDSSATSLFSFLDRIRAQYGTIGLVVIDPTLRMLQNVDEFKASEIGSSVFRISERLQNRYQCGVVLVHHKSKGSSIDSIKQSYGSMGFHAFAEGTWYLGAPDEDGWTPVRAEFKSARESDWRFRFVDLDQSYQVESSDDVPLKMVSGRGDQDLPKKILSLLQKISEGLSAKQIVEAIDGSSDYMIRQALKVLQSQGQVEKKRDLSLTSSPGAKGDLWFAVNPPEQ